MLLIFCSFPSIYRVRLSFAYSINVRVFDHVPGESKVLVPLSEEVPILFLWLFIFLFFLLFLPFPLLVFFFSLSAIFFTSDYIFCSIFFFFYFLFLSQYGNGFRTSSPMLFCFHSRVSVFIVFIFVSFLFRFLFILVPNCFFKKG